MAACARRVRVLIFVLPLETGSLALARWPADRQVAGRQVAVEPIEPLRMSSGMSELTSYTTT